MKNSSKRLKVIQPEKFIICKKILTLVLLINIQACYSAAVIDDFVENSLDKNLQIKPYAPSIINDEFAESNKKYSRIKPYEKLKPVDEELPKTVNKPVRRKEFILEENRTPVQICIKEIYSSKKKLEEGSYLEFKTISDVNYKGKFYPAGTPVRARLETLSPRGTWGTPAEIVIGNFSIGGKPLYGEITRNGTNRILWVRPLAIAGGIFFGTGIFFMFIKGGHAKIKPDEIFTVYY
ncbi:MAG: hypothetical protein BHW62_07840 [Acinetobacter sp. CAG:196_36_41]|nr:MAG: hypothetical protein BHW62_07840 [Acinetobacter sp. CAG:196_36_41]